MRSLRVFGSASLLAATCAGPVTRRNFFGACGQLGLVILISSSYLHVLHASLSSGCYKRIGYHKEPISARLEYARL